MYAKAKYLVNFFCWLFSEQYLSIAAFTKITRPEEIAFASSASFIQERKNEIFNINQITTTITTTDLASFTLKVVDYKSFLIIIRHGWASSHCWSIRRVPQFLQCWPISTRVSKRWIISDIKYTLTLFDNLSYNMSNVLWRI